MINRNCSLNFGNYESAFRHFGIVFPAIYYPPPHAPTPPRHHARQPASPHTSAINHAAVIPITWLRGMWPNKYYDGRYRRPDGVLSGKQCCRKFRAPRIRVLSYRVSGASICQLPQGISGCSKQPGARRIIRIVPDAHSGREGLSISRPSSDSKLAVVDGQPIRQLGHSDSGPIPIRKPNFGYLCSCQSAAAHMTGRSHARPWQLQLGATTKGNVNGRWMAYTCTSPPGQSSVATAVTVVCNN